MREQVIEALVAKMQGLASVKQVLAYDDLDRIAATGIPAVMVIDTDEERIPRTGGFADVYLTVELKGVIRATSDAEKRINALDKEIKAAIAADRTLGGLVAYVDIEPRADSDLSGDEALAIFTRPVRVYYVANEAQGE